MPVALEIITVASEVAMVPMEVSEMELTEVSDSREVMVVSETADKLEDLEIMVNQADSVMETLNQDPTTIIINSHNLEEMTVVSDLMTAEVSDLAEVTIPEAAALDQEVLLAAAEVSDLPVAEEAEASEVADNI